MKHFISVLLISLIVSCSTKPKITGEWTSQDKYGQQETTIFKDDGSLVVIKGNKVEDFNFKDKTLRYTVDHSHTPAWIDFIVFDDKNKEEVVRMKGICEFLSENTLRVCFNEPSRYTQDLDQTMLVRPAEFNSEHTEVLTRK